MRTQEIAFAKQGALATNDWDTYQIIIRRCLAGSFIHTPPPISVNERQVVAAPPVAEVFPVTERP